MNAPSLLRNARRHITNEEGETLVETLVSILVSVLALLLLSTAIVSSINMVMASRSIMEDSYNSEAAMVTDSDGLPESGPYPKIHFGIPLELDEDGNTIDISVKYYKTDNSEADEESGGAAVSGEGLAYYEKVTP